MENIIIDELIPVNKVEKKMEFSVSEISSLIRRNLEKEFSYVKIRGEISGLKIAPSGHVYLSLKDNDAVIAVVCWKNTFQKLSFKPEDGMEVVCAGSITSYPGSSRYQLNALSFEHAGSGALMAMLEQRKKQLIAEGVFDQSRKKPLPAFPKFVGIVTSPTGAVIRDIIHRTEGRFPARLVVWPVLVQGQDAQNQIANAINGFNNLNNKPDLIIVARGGGSIEDLWCFNSEEVVRAVFASKIPVISAVGHETDFTLIDFVADVRAPTPTAAAEIALPMKANLENNITKMMQKISREVDYIFDNKASRLEILSRSLPKPEYLYQVMGNKITEIFNRCQRILQELLNNKTRSFYNLSVRLQTPKMLIEKEEIRLKAVIDKLPKLIDSYFQKNNSSLQNYSNMLEALSHLGTLKRGYSLVKSLKTNQLVASSQLLQSAEQIEIIMHDGTKQARIE